MKYKEWIIPEYKEADVNILAKHLSVSPILSKLLIKRGISTEIEANAFLKKDYSVFYSPFLMKDVKNGADILINAVKNKEKILIWGDYDVDGVTSVTVLLKYIRSIGGICEYYIPKRSEDGYGLNGRVFKKYADDGFRLVITVDSGITAIDEVILAKELGMKVIITDHHECREQLPDADAVINPKRHDCTYPFKELAGVGVVFKFICGIEALFKNTSFDVATHNIVSNYSEFIAIGTIADVMPICGENRVIVSCGLKALESPSNIGLQALIKEAGIDLSSSKKRGISSTTVGFVLAPRINAAGRMDTSRISVDLFMTENHDEAEKLAATLTSINKTRQLMENEILISANEKINTQCDLSKDKVIILDDDNWHHGIIGIVSSRITEKYNLPSVLISFKNDNSPNDYNIGKGSARSVKGMNLVEALADSSEYLLKFGGHELAAGLSVERSNLEAFRKKINEYAKTNLDPSNLVKKLEIDCEIDSQETTVSIAKELALLEPFGLSNPVPLFTMSNAKINSINSIGNGKHTKLLVEKNSKLFTALLFGTPITSLQLNEGDNIDIAFNLDINTFKNQLTLQLIVRDFRPSKIERDVHEQHIHKYNCMLYDDNYIVDIDDIPTRTDFAEIYSMLKNYLFASGDNKNLDIFIPYFTKMSNKKYNSEIPLFKALIIFDVLIKEHLIEVYNHDLLFKTIKHVAPIEQNKKIQLNETETIKKLISKVKH